MEYAHKCEVCDSGFPHKHGTRRANRCCSRRCGFELQRRERTAKRLANTPAPFTPVYPCGVCGQYSKRKRCSVECEVEWQRRRSLRCWNERHPRTSDTGECRECGELFAVTHGNNDAGKCPSCVKAKQRRIAHATDRAKRRGCTEIEHFDPREVYEAADWCCELCGGKLQPLKSYPEPESPSLDHIVPISSGGQHTRDNVRAAHLVCNWREYHGDWPSHSLDRAMVEATAVPF